LKTITPILFLEQIALGAQVQPFDGAFQLGLQVGRYQYVCELEDFNAPQQRHFEQLYRARKVRFGFPGDFRVAPYFFRGPLNTHCRTP
jgi:hypothetical protein